MGIVQYRQEFLSWFVRLCSEHGCNKCKLDVVFDLLMANIRKVFAFLHGKVFALSLRVLKPLSVLPLKTPARSCVRNTCPILQFCCVISTHSCTPKPTFDPLSGPDPLQEIDKIPFSARFRGVGTDFWNVLRFCLVKIGQNWSKRTKTDSIE